MKNFRMKPHVFKNWYDKMKMMGLLKDQRDISVEGVAIGLEILCHGIH